jgi:uncharacterized protein
LPANAVNVTGVAVPQRRLLIVFVKAPRAGNVKTRLAQRVGAEAACLIYQVLVGNLLRHIDSLGSVQLRFSPDDAERDIHPWRHKGWTLAPQGSGDLGRRLMAAFREAFAAGFERVAIIGSDSPELTSEDIQAAWDALDTHDLVLGPTKDGGYWLIALRRLVPRRKIAQLFQGIPWSTERVFNQTIEQARAADMHVNCLRELHDIDTEQDWKAYLRRNAFAEMKLRG